MKKVINLKPGTRMIFVQTPLEVPFLKLIHEKEYRFSWGNSPVYIKVKQEM
jgi:hypothetical protein